MSDGAKIALAIVGVGAVGYLVLSKTAAPATAPKGVAPSGTTTAWISGVVSGIGSWFSKGPSGGGTPTNAPLAGINDPGFDSRDISSIDEFRAEDSTTMTDSQRDAAILG
jgi:hypothetical protein